MEAFQVADKPALKQVLHAFSQLDAIRWSQPLNYNLLNYCSDDLTDDEKLLTHWLCYVVDRQTRFKRVWDVGGYVLSHLVREYSRTPPAPRRLLDDYLRHGNSQDEPKAFLECPIDEANPRLARYGFDGDEVRFSSRFMASDLVLIHRTLALLDRAGGRSLAQFIARTGVAVEDQPSAVDITGSALNALTYAEARKVKSERLEAALDEADRWVDSQAPLLDSKPLEWVKEHLGGFNRYKDRKRLWCSIRDYLKSPEFNPVFVSALREAGLQDWQRWEHDGANLRPALDRLELPGDVWNNRPIFREGLFSPFLAGERQSWNMPCTVREVHTRLKKDGDPGFYPEQLDVTFDFVPRMCETEMCDVCPFGAGVKNVCHDKEGLLCPVALTTCGYRHTCDPAECEFRHDPVKGLCRRSVATT